MDARKFKEVSLDVRKYFNKEDKTNQVLEFLGDMDEVFWQSISLVHFVSDLVQENIKHSIYLPVFILSNKFINHTVASYEMLLMHLENEQIILYRQSLEVQWLVKYFIENPQDIKPWLLDKDIYNKLRGVKALPLAKVPGTTRLLSKLANEINKDFTGRNTCGVLFLLAQN